VTACKAGPVFGISGFLPAVDFQWCAEAAGPGAALDVDALDTAEEESKIVGLC